MKNLFPDGVWPVMLTPFTEDNRVDYGGLEKLVNWYFENGSDGLFAVCQSSEMFFLSLEERCEIASFVKRTAKGRPVIASGHIADGAQEQTEELKRMADTGIDALILITNRLAAQEEGDDLLLRHLEVLLKALPDELPLGLYECPYPYKRILSPEVTAFCAQTGRFHFLKDTSCHMDSIRAKLRLLEGTEMKLYNANTATLLDSLKEGAAGYSGVMANFHPGLYHWLCENYEKEPEKAEHLAELLTMCSLIENNAYPVNAKYALQRLGLPVTLMTRKLSADKLTYAMRREAEQLLSLTEETERRLAGREE